MCPFARCLIDFSAIDAPLKIRDKNSEILYDLGTRNHVDP